MSSKAECKHCKGCLVSSLQSEAGLDPRRSHNDVTDKFEMDGSVKVSRCQRVGGAGCGKKGESSAPLQSDWLRSLLLWRRLDAGFQVRRSRQLTCETTVCISLASHLPINTNAHIRSSQPPPTSPPDVSTVASDDPPLELHILVFPFERHCHMARTHDHPTGIALLDSLCQLHIHLRRGFTFLLLDAPSRSRRSHQRNPKVPSLR